MERPTPIAAVATLLLLAACAARDARSPAPVDPAPPAAPSVASTGPPLARYRCDHDIAFTVRFSDDSAQLDAGTHGSETLLRDAGGVTPQQTVYSSTAIKAEFGLDPGGRGAKLHFADPPIEASCVRE